MGCNAIGAGVADRAAFNETDIISLIVTKQTELAKRKIRSMGEFYDINMPVNFKGDTLLHYACANADVKLV